MIDMVLMLRLKLELVIQSYFGQMNGFWGILLRLSYFATCAFSYLTYDKVLVKEIL